MDCESVREGGPIRRPHSQRNIANMYCTECIIGIIQNAGTPSRLRFARTRRDEGRRERQASNYGIGREAGEAKHKRQVYGVA